MTGENWEDYLEPGEQLLWQGAPVFDPQNSKPSVGSVITTAIFTVATLGYLIFGRSNSSGDAPAEFPDFYILIFVFLPAIWVFLVRPYFARQSTKKTRYALTNNRAIIASSLLGNDIQSYEITKDMPIFLIEGKRDSVTFAKTEQIINGYNRTNHIGFKDIENGAEVHEMLRAVKKTKK